MSRFNIRVYGILKNEQNCVLVSDEFIKGNYFTKFPGGGLEFGEGTRDCLKREFKEETGLDVEVKNHIYTTDFFQISSFNNSDQIISIYYFVECKNLTNLIVKEKVFDFSPSQISDPNGESEVTRWISWDELTVNSVTLPIDKKVVEIIKQSV